MTVQLEAPLTRSYPQRRPECPPDQAIATAPRYMRSGYMRHGALGRWHRPRSGVRLGLTGSIVYHTWCGQTMFAERTLTADQPGPDERVCGTCEGRAVGAGQDTWPVEGGPALLFEPRRLTPPARCPGSRSEQLYRRVGQDVLLCLACGDLVVGRGHGYRYGPRNHPPGQGLVPGCEFHAWDYLVPLEGSAACACRAPEFTADPQPERTGQ